MQENINDNLLQNDTIDEKKLQNRRKITLQPPPYTTIAILIITTIGTGLQTIFPAVLSTLRRNPSALAAGEWWRVITPLAVNDGNPWLHYLLVSLGIALVGIPMEQSVGRVRWFILFFAAFFVGTAVGYFWDPNGAGASIALCGLIGGLVIWQIRQHTLQLFASIYALGLASALACEAILALLVNDTLVAVVSTAIISWLLITVLVILRGRAKHASVSTYYVGAIVLLSALALTLLRDIHGAALLTGLVVAALLLWNTRRGPSLTRTN